MTDILLPPSNVIRDVSPGLLPEFASAAAAAGRHRDRRPRRAASDSEAATATDAASAAGYYDHPARRLRLHALGAWRPSESPRPPRLRSE
jgi:hypothetical protein